MDAHVKAVHEKVKSHQCEYCEKLFSTNIMFKSVHEKIKDHQCEHCEMAFSSSRDLKRHKNIHSDI